MEPSGIPRLPGQAKAGFWYQTAGFTSADAASSKVYQGNCGVYAVIDQMVYREPVEEPTVAGNGGKSAQGLGWFGRMGFGPQDRNFLGFYSDAGLTYKGLIPTRNDDTFGIAFACGRLTDGASRTLRDEGPRGVGGEMVLEVSYQCQASPWLTVQPDLQYIINPGATRDDSNALVIGARASITF